jgi:hypothetical protein
MKRVLTSFVVTLVVFVFAVGSATAGPITFENQTDEMQCGFADGFSCKYQSIGTAWGDYNNDGFMDMYLALAFFGDSRLGRNNRLYEQQEDGTFTNVAKAKGVEQVIPWTTIDGCGGVPEEDCVDRSGISRGISWGDCDNDGDLDLLVGSMDSGGADPPVPFTTLYINNGPPDFDFEWTSCSRGIHQKEQKQECTDEYRGGLNGTSGGIAWGDYNGDGCLDIIWRVTDQHADAVLLENKKESEECTCTFSEVTKEAGANLFTPLRKTSFASEEGGPKRSLVLTASLQGNANWVDYDNDGDQDLFHPNDGDMNVLFRNDGGTFTDVSTIPGYEGNALANTGQTYGACWGDLDNDGDLDCYITNSGEANRLVRNDLIENGGTPGFSERTFEGPPSQDRFPPPPQWPDSGAGHFGDATSCTMGDYDNDGDLDIYVNQGGPRNNLFNDANPIDPMTTQFYSANTPDLNVLLQNDGPPPPPDDPPPNWDPFVIFTDVTESSGAEHLGEGRGVSTADYNDDGLLDLYVTAFVPDPVTGDEVQGSLLKNTTANGNNWIKFALVGARDRGALGARVTITTSDGGIQIREVTSAHGYNSQNDPRAHFGLGTDKTVTSAEVRWSNGVVTTALPTAMNMVHTVTE